MNTEDSARMINFQQKLKDIVHRRRKDYNSGGTKVQERNDAPLAPDKRQQSERLRNESQKYGTMVSNGVESTLSNGIELLKLNEAKSSERNGAELLKLDEVQAPESNGVESFESNEVQPSKSNIAGSHQNSFELPKPLITTTPGGIVIPVGLVQPKIFPCWRCRESGHGFETCSRKIWKSPHFCIYCGANRVSCFYCACKLGKGQYSYATPEEMAEAALARQRHRHGSHYRRPTALQNHSSNRRSD